MNRRRPVSASQSGTARQAAGRQREAKSSAGVPIARCLSSWREAPLLSWVCCDAGVVLLLAMLVVVPA